MFLFFYDLIVSFVIITIFADDAYRERSSGDVIIVVVGDKTDVFSCMMSLIPGELGTYILASARLAKLYGVS